MSKDFERGSGFLTNFKVSKPYGRIPDGLSSAIGERGHRMAQEFTL